MNKSSESYKVYLDKSEAAKSGVHSTQPEGRKALPPVNNNIPKAEVKPDSYVQKLTDDQLGMNRYPINTNEEKHKTHGPNN
jgi:hypothetical protein